MIEFAQWTLFIVIGIFQVMIIDMISKHTDKLKELNNCKSSILDNNHKLYEGVLALTKEYNKLKTDLDFIESKVTGNTEVIDGLEAEINNIRDEMDFHAAANIERYEELCKNIEDLKNLKNGDCDGDDVGKIADPA